jgi:hypothetical protein
MRVITSSAAITSDSLISRLIMLQKPRRSTRTHTHAHTHTNTYLWSPVPQPYRQKHIESGSALNLREAHNMMFPDKEFLILREGLEKVGTFRTGNEMVSPQ